MKRVINKLFVPKDVDDDNRYLGEKVKFYALDRYADTENTLCKILEQIFLKCEEQKEELVAKLCRDYVDHMLKRSVGAKDYMGKLQKIYEKTDGTGGACGGICDQFKFVYYCLDCQQGDSAIFCPNCFSDSNHQGHRAYRDTNVGGFCDCGDPALWDPKGFCTEHTGKLNQDSSWPEAKRREFQEYLIKGLFPIIQVWDRHQIRPVKHVQIVGMLFKDFILPALVEMWDISDPVAVKTVIAESLISPITRVARDCQPKLFHHHDDYLSKKPLTRTRQDCHCTVLALILRHSLLLNTDGDNEEANPLNKFFSDLCTVPHFKKHLATEYFRHMRLFYHYDHGKEELIASDLLDSQFLILGAATSQAEVQANCDIPGTLESLKIFMVDCLDKVSAKSRPKLYQHFLTKMFNLIELFLPEETYESQSAVMRNTGPTATVKNGGMLKLGMPSFFVRILGAFDQNCEDMIAGTAKLGDSDEIETLTQQLFSELTTAHFVKAVGSTIIKATGALPPSDKTAVRSEE